MYSRLKDLRLDNDLLQKNLANIINLDKGTYARYECEYYIMPLKHLIKVCDYFNVSLDYVFDFSNDKCYKNINKEIDNYVVGNRLKEFRKENKLTQTKLGNILNTTKTVICGYEKGRYLIATPFLYTICKKYNISADYLLGRVDEPKYLETKKDV